MCERSGGVVGIASRINTPRAAASREGVPCTPLHSPIIYPNPRQVMSESARNIDRWYTAVGLQANSSMAIPVAAVEVFMCIHGLNLFMNMSSIRRKGLTLYMVVASVLTVISCINAVTSGIFSFRIFLDTSQSLDNVNEALHSHDNSVVDHIVSFTLIGQRWIGDALLVTVVPPRMLGHDTQRRVLYRFTDASSSGTTISGLPSLQYLCS
ncbi:hypothetical protein CC2G_014445 [Coprinopsis cinerea AmutBmut pab1-1]|nr:hypothetical protein CC2G_014445 [Coprinopsis cinerea AmutBmut pab1-1]